MTILNDKEPNHLQAYIDASEEALDPLVITTHHDMRALGNLLKRSPKVSHLAKPFDPDLHHNMQGFWISIDFEGVPIACVGARLFECEDFVQEWVKTDRMAGTKPPRMKMADTVYSGLLPVLKGNVVITGASWVHPDWRGHDLSGVTSRLGKLFSRRAFHADSCVAFIRQDRAAWAKEVLGWPNSCPLSTGEHSTRDGFIVDTAMHWISAWDILHMSPVPRVGKEAARRLRHNRLLEKLVDDTTVQQIQCAV